MSIIIITTAVTITIGITIISYYHMLSTPGLR